MKSYSNVQLIMYQEGFYLDLGENVYGPLDIKALNGFLQNYDQWDFYNKMEKTLSPQSLPEDCYKLMATVDSLSQLKICTSELMQIVLTSQPFPYITTDEYAEKHNRKKAIVLRLCRDGRIEGAVQINSVWLIPTDAPYPEDARYGARVQSSRVLAQKPVAGILEKGLDSADPKNKENA